MPGDDEATRPKWEFGRKDKKSLRHWAGIAWDRELGAELTQLGAAIDGWQAGQLSPHDVSEAIHEFHDGAARDLYRFYTRAEPASAVAQAVVHGVISEAELPRELLAGLTDLIQRHQQLAAAEESRQAEPVNAIPSLKPSFTRLQGLYLAFIDSYTRLRGVAPAEADLQEYFQVTPPSVHQMILTLERHDLISRVPGQPRSIRLLVSRENLPPLGDEN